MVRLCPVFVLSLLFSLYLIVPRAAEAAVIYVDGSLPASCAPGQYSVASRTCGGNDGSGYRTFASAVSAMQPGDTVDVRGGTYTTAVTVNKSGTASAHLRIRGHAGETAIINLAGTGSAIAGLDVTFQSYIDVERLVILNSTGYGFKAGLASNITVSDSEFAYSFHSGVVFDSATNVSVTRSKIHHNNVGVGSWNEGITFGGVNGFSLTDSEIYENNHDGVNAKYNSRFGVIARNHVYKNKGPGIYLDAANNIKVTDNVVHDTTNPNKACIALGIEETYNPSHFQETDVTVANNVLYGCGAGIHMWIEDSGLGWARFDRIRIDYNTIVDNTANVWGGIYIINGTPSNFGSAGSTIRNNIFIGNGGRGLRDASGATASWTVSDNLFGNGEQSTLFGVAPVFTSANQFVDRAGHNYHLVSTSVARFQAVPIADITADIEGSLRPASSPDIGAYQYDAAPNTPPVAQASSDVTSGTNPLTVTFNASASYDPDSGDTISYAWDLNGNGMFGDSTSATPTYTYTSAGTYTATLQVTDSHGATDTASVVITVGVGTPPTVAMSAPAATATYRVGDGIAFAGGATDPDTGLALPASTLVWRVFLSTCLPTCTETLQGTFTGVAGGTFVVPDQQYPSSLRFELTATKASGLTSTVSRTIQPQTTTVTLASSPIALSLSIYGAAAVAPVTRTVVVNAQMTVTATSPQTVGGITYAFSSWSDGGASSHAITATASPMTLTATYNATGSPASVWNSWDIVTQSGSPQGVVTAAATGIAANLEFYESTNNAGVTKGALFGAFNAGAHPETFNNVQQYWGAASGATYPYAGKSTVNRGSGAGETGTPSPTGVRDLQMHPPSSAHYTVAAFRVPTNGTYAISNLGVRRVSNLGGAVVFHILNAQQVEIASLQATANQAWVTSPTTYTLTGLVAGNYLYFAVDAGGDFSYDATEIAWKVTGTSTAPPPPPAPSCALGVSPTSITAGASTTLSWTTMNATALTIDQGIGAVSPVASGSMSRTPSATTTYTATATGAGGTATCSTTVTVTPPGATSVWNSWDITTQAGSPQGRVAAAATGVIANIEFYESTNNAGVLKGSLFGTFNSGTHPEAFNSVGQYWGPAAGATYPYAGKSTINRGVGTGETGAPPPAGVRDLQVHPPNNAHNVVAAFRVPTAGTYTITNLGVRRVSNLGGNVGLHVFNTQQVEIATMQATPNRAWVTTPTTYTLTNLAAGSYIYFAVDRGVDFSYDATEIAWTVTRTGP